MKQVLLFGHSHVWSIKKAIAAGLYSPLNSDINSRAILCGTKDFPGPLVGTAFNGRQAINATLIAALSKIDKSIPAEDVWLTSVCQGNFYNVLGLLNVEREFDVVIPHRNDLDVRSGVELVPYDALKTQLRDMMMELQMFLTALPGLGYKYIIQVNAPPPVRSNDYIKEQLISQKALEDGDSVASPNIRLKLWLIQQEAIKEMCGELGVHCLVAPIEAVDEVGFLKEEYWKDSVHANEHYSALLLRDIEEFVCQNGRG